MWTASLLPEGYAYRPSLRSRAAAGVLSLAIIALVALVLLAIGQFHQDPDPVRTQLTALQIEPEGNTEKRTAARREQAAARRQPVQPQVPQVPQPEVTPIPLATATPFRFMPISRQDYAAGDISKLPGRSAGSASAGDGSKTYGPGEGPGGARLFNAEWYREPTDAELAGYLKGGAAPGSWATIACQTVEHYHVENCQQLDEFPAGSGLSRAMRQAGWQFLVRPPRVNGKPVLGAWVRIRIEFTAARKPSAEATSDQ